MTREYTEAQAQERIAKLERRLDRRSRWADSADAESEERYQRSRVLVGDMPLGQPIPNNASGRTMRNRVAKANDAMGRSVEAGKRAKHHRGVANNAAAEIREIERRVKGPAFGKESGIKKGDRIATSAGLAEKGGIDAIVVRANAKTVSVAYCHSCPADTPFDQVRFTFGYDQWDNYPNKVKWLKVHAAFDAEGAPIPSLHD